MSATYFCASSYRFRDIKILIFLPSQSSSSSWRVILSINLSMAYVKIYKCLPHILHMFLSFQRYKHFILFTFKKQVKVTECNFRNYTIRWQMSKSTDVFHTFCASSYRFRYINILNCSHSKSRSRSPSTIFANI